MITIRSHKHAEVPSLVFFFVLFFANPPRCFFAAARPPPSPLPLPPSTPPDSNATANFNPSVAMLMMILITALFCLVVFSIYILQCSSGSTAGPQEYAGRSRRGVPVTRGLEAAVILGFPTFVYSEVKEHKIGKGALECVVCLSEFEDDETLRLIPKCDHVFHPECIDEWLSEHGTCPVCRANLFPQSGDSVKGGTVGSGPEEPVEIGEPPVLAEESALGMVAEAERREEEVAEELNRNRARGLRSGKPRRFGRSHSTGHSLVRRGEDTERFTLRLPDEVRRQIMERPTTPYFPGEGSSRRGYRVGDGSSRGRFLRRLDRLDRSARAKSERWVFSKMPSFLFRVSSTVSPRSPKFTVPSGGPDGSAKSTADRDRSVKFDGPVELDRPTV